MTMSARFWSTSVLLRSYAVGGLIGMRQATAERDRLRRARTERCRSGQSIRLAAVPAVVGATLAIGGSV
ncbi:hypothetical protein ADK76_28980 [Streptomyces griseoflavus]|nr:hypothetical protein ADK76_28980 [Streptomyces griseoflavus]